VLTIGMSKNELKKSWNEKARERYPILKGIYERYRKYNSLKGVSKIPITYFESHYSEYMIAQKLIDEGFTIKGMYGKGYDIKCNNKKIEVKSARLQKTGMKHNSWGWVVKEKQWKTPDHFDYLVCVALEYKKDQNGILVFSYEDVKNNFTNSDWRYLKFNTRVKNYLRLNLTKQGYDAFEENIKVMKEKIEYKGEPSEFEVELNKNQDKAFQDYSWEKFIKDLESPTLNN
jgi:hypothetical protein